MVHYHTGGGTISPNVFAIKIFPKKFAYFGKFGDMKKIIFSFKNEKRVGFFEISVIWANSAILEQKWLFCLKNEKLVGFFCNFNKIGLAISGLSCIKLIPVSLKIGFEYFLEKIINFSDFFKFRKADFTCWCTAN